MKKLFLIAAMAATCFAAKAQDLKFAHVDFSELVQLMPEMDKAREVTDAASAEAQKTYEAIVKGDPMPPAGIPESLNVLLHELRGLGLKVTLD